jgi:hypothetical protein
VFLATWPDICCQPNHTLESYFDGELGDFAADFAGAGSLPSLLAL